MGNMSYNFNDYTKEESDYIKKIHYENSSLSVFDCVDKIIHAANELTKYDYKTLNYRNIFYTHKIEYFTTSKLVKDLYDFKYYDVIIETSKKDMLLAKKIYENVFLLVKGLGYYVKYNSDYYRDRPIEEFYNVFYYYKDLLELYEREHKKASFIFV